ncbi:MAG: hypothetical protein JWP31_2514 [Aeromicrobium sp.]|nr:hypothetical protein [Aeromicrobium sp.]
MPDMDATPASDADRRAAVDDLTQLLSDGRITTEDFANRSRAVSQATTLAELTSAVAPAPVSYGSVPRGPDPVVAPVRSEIGRILTGQPLAELMTRIVTAANLRLLAGLALFLVIAGGLALSTSLFGLSSDVEPPSSSPVPTLFPSDSPGRDPRLLTTGGLTRLRAALRADQGSTRYVGGVIYPGYASIELPVKGDPDVSRRAYFNGALAISPSTTPRADGSRSADLRDLDARALAKAVRRAPRVLGVTNPTATYVVLDERDGGPAMTIYLTDRARRTGYWTMRLDGRTVRTYRG